MTLNYRDFAAIGRDTDAAATSHAVETARAKMNSSANQPASKPGPIAQELERTHKLLDELRVMNEEIRSRLSPVLPPYESAADIPAREAPGKSDVAHSVCRINNLLCAELEFLGELKVRIEL